MNLKRLNKEAAKVFNEAIYGLKKPGDSKKFDNGGPSIMALHVECIGNSKYGLIFSFAHYYKQNGDMMRDPDMEFLVTDAKNIFPLTFRMDPGFFTEAARFRADGKLEFNRSAQNDIKNFANKWMMNLKHQQFNQPANV